MSESLNFMDFDRKTLESQLTEYEQLGKKIDNLKKKRDNIRNYIAKYMHYVKENCVFVDTPKGSFKCSFETKKFKRIDKAVLREILTEEMFNQVYSESESTALVIRHVKNKTNKKDDLVKTPPNKEKKNIERNVPDIGVLS